MIPEVLEAQRTLNKSLKRILKSEIPKQDSTLRDIEQDIIQHFNTLTTRLQVYYGNLKISEQEKVLVVFNKSRARVATAFQTLKVNYSVPRVIGTRIDRKILAQESDTISIVSELSDLSDSETEDIPTEEGKPKFETMPQSKFDLGKYINSTVSTFDGSFDNLDRFKNQIDLVQEITEPDNVGFALKQIKIKINNVAILAKLKSVGTLMIF